MPKKLLKKFMPANDKVLHSKSMQYISEHILRAHVWHLNRRSASRAALIGLFFAFVPVPMQMIFAAIVCIYMRANLPLTLAFVWITNPITAAPIFYATYKVGAVLLGLPTYEFEFEFEMNMDGLGEVFSLIWKPLFLGSFLTGTAVAAIGYTTIDFLWRWKTIQRWHHRDRRRARCQRKAEKQLHKIELKQALQEQEEYKEEHKKEHNKKH